MLFSSWDVNVTVMLESKGAYEMEYAEKQASGKTNTIGHIHVTVHFFAIVVIWHYFLF